MKTCPKCQSNMIIDIVYGFPSEELAEDANNNRVQLGGCCVGGDDPKFKCKSCGNAFGESDQYGCDFE